MRRRSSFALSAVCAAAALTGMTGHVSAQPQRHLPDPGRQTLAAKDGWASYSTGTTGGSTARPGQVRVVRTRDQLAAAVTGDLPKIVYVKGTIDGNVDSRNKRLTCDDYATGGYSLPAFLTAYDPATWGRVDPSGPLEEARKASALRQKERVEIPVGANTTIVGLEGARIKGANLVLRDVDNVIVRGIEFQNAFDCFPAWDPNDGEFGEWNAEYDPISLYGATHVWIDHNTLNDGDMPDSEQPTHFGRVYQVHDGLLDITHGSDLVTVSWNRFTDHDKVMLIGHSDSSTLDTRKLRVTLHHNLFTKMGQRTPRVRFGQVDVYNNHYAESSGEPYLYSWGVGVQSAIVAEHNAFTLPADIDPADVIEYWKGTAIHAADNRVDGASTDLLAAYNAAYDPDLSPDVGWTPTRRRAVHRSRDVPRLVRAAAGADRLSRPGRIALAGSGG
ncbi:polysaccharide lyase family 1 protein [Actinomadura sp. HBU206391]|uniref:pectate lyase family protein n=1 Tax=Actinomadura sp. HBU206391 TaxID=2731692 RepID=UPI00164F2A13|nr:pectate lyase [Actinomadura sp. HBU206391]MBC6458217.1 pectate lyase [Actinomadura sp. HBU206391]